MKYKEFEKWLISAVSEYTESDKAKVTSPQNTISDKNAQKVTDNLLRKCFSPKTIKN